MTPHVRLRNLTSSSQLKTSLQNAEVVVQPPVKETTKLLTSFIKNVAESCRRAPGGGVGACGNGHGTQGGWGRGAAPPHCAKGCDRAG
jgi:hypothetical protein